MAGDFTIAGEHQFLVTWDSKNLRFERTFEEVSEFDKTAQTSILYDAGKETGRSWSDRAKFADVTVGSMFRPETDAALISDMLQYVGKEDGTLLIQPIDADYAPSGDPFTINGRLSGVKGPKADAQGSGNQAKWSFTISPIEVK